MERRWIYYFGQGLADADDAMKHLVGGKGASLAAMTRAGLNVPPGFTISTEACAWYFEHDRTWPPELDPALRVALVWLEERAARSFGRGDRPLLVAVRSGAAQSMPGMMDTVLNVGLNPDSVRAIAARTGHGRSVWETYLHFQRMFASTVGGIDKARLADVWRRFLQEAGSAREDDLDAAQLEALCGRVAECYRAALGRDFPTDPWAMLCAAINAVFESWQGERAVTYRRDHGIDELLGTAVTVQMMCPAEVSGVLFTANPVDPARGEILIDAAFGLGETVVLGEVTPDHFVLDKETLDIRQRVIAVKERHVAALTEDGRNHAVRRDAASLTDVEVQALGRLGLRVEKYCNGPCDIEWARAQGEFYLLQARPIAAATGIGAEERAEVRREEIEALRAKTAPGGTVWSRYILAEILPEPTPMSWAVVRRLMSVSGGYGLMYRDLGFDPDPALGDDGIFDLVCGRPYCNLSREPRIQYRTLPFEHPFALLKQDPQRALRPKAVLRPNWRFFLTFPFVFLRLSRDAAKVQGVQQRFADDFEQRILPQFLQEVERAGSDDWSGLDTDTLLQCFQHWIQRTLVEFARDSLKPTALAEMQMNNLVQALARRLRQGGAARAEALLRELIMEVAPAGGADLDAALAAMQEGRLARAEFLERFGHRGADEMELAAPRFSEDDSALNLLTGTTDGDVGRTAESSSQAAWHKLAEEARLTLPAERAAVERELSVLKRHVALREAGKHYLLRGYALIRRALVALDRRYRLDGGIFFLTPDELPLLKSATLGQPPPELVELIERRRRRRAAALSLYVPPVLYSDDLEAIDRPFVAQPAGTLQGVPLSMGIAEGQALVVENVRQLKVPPGDFILVCPKTDPGWVLLVRQARGLVMETGGVLSHGAIVARNYRKPAVAGIPDVLRRVRTGQRLRIDGTTGQVLILP